MESAVVVACSRLLPGYGTHYPLGANAYLGICAIFSSGLTSLSEYINFMFLSFSFFPFFSSAGSPAFGTSDLVTTVPAALSASLAAPDNRSSKEVALADKGAGSELSGGPPPAGPLGAPS